MLAPAISRFWSSHVDDANAFKWHLFFVHLIFIVFVQFKHDLLGLSNGPMDGYLSLPFQPARLSPSIHRTKYCVRVE